MTFKCRWQKLKSWHTVTAVTLLLLVIILAYYINYVPKSTLEPTATEGVVYGRVKGSTLRIAFISEKDSQLYVIEPNEGDVFEIRLPEGTYKVIHLFGIADLSSSSLQIMAGKKQRIRLPSFESKTLGIHTQARVINPSRILSSTDVGWDIPPSIAFTVPDEHTILFEADHWPELFDFVFENWEELHQLGQVEVPTYSTKSPGFSHFFGGPGTVLVETEWVVL